MKINILGIGIDNLARRDVLKEVEHFLQSEKSHHIVTPYSEFIVTAQKDAEFKNFINSADIAVPDGMGILWAGEVLYGSKKYSNGSEFKEGISISLTFRKLSVFFSSLLNIFLQTLHIVFFPKRFRNIFPEKISGVDLIWNIAEIAHSTNKSIFLLGGWDNTPGIVAAKLKERYPDLEIVGTYAGSPGLEEEEKIIQIIRDKKPDVLLVAFGPVRQEKWIAKNLSRLPFLKLAIGLGGTFDYLAGKRTLAPRFLRERGLEWLFRLFTQPWRIGRIGKGIPIFVWLVIREKLRQYNAQNN